MQNSLELHQPNMHIGYRVIPLSVHIVSLARSIFNGIWPTLLQIINCCRIFWRWVRTTFGFRVYNQHVFACGASWRWRLFEDLFPLLYLFWASYKLCKDVSNHLFFQVWIIRVIIDTMLWYFIVDCVCKWIDPGVCTIHRYLAIF